MFYKALDLACIGHGGLGLGEGAALAQQFGFDGLWLDAGRDFLGKPGEARAVLDRHHLRAAGFGLPLDFRGEEAAFQRGMDKLPGRAAFAREIGISRCVTWILPAHEQLDYQRNYALHQDRLTQAARVLKAEGIWLGLEFVAPQSLRQQAPHPFIHNLEGMLGLCQDIGTGNCGILLDAWHWHLAGQSFEDFDRFSEPGQMVCAHICDAPANVPDELQVDTVRRLPGTTGIINSAQFFAGLQKAGFDGPVVVEPFEPFLARIPAYQAVALVKQHLDRVWPGEC